jgi:hypothetical protein
MPPTDSIVRLWVMDGKFSVYVPAESWITSFAIEWLIASDSVL